MTSNERAIQIGSAPEGLTGENPKQDDARYPSDDRDANPSHSTGVGRCREQECERDSDKTDIEFGQECGRGREAEPAMCTEARCGSASENALQPNRSRDE